MSFCSLSTFPLHTISLLLSLISLQKIHFLPLLFLHYFSFLPLIVIHSISIFHYKYFPTSTYFSKFRCTLFPLLFAVILVLIQLVYIEISSTSSSRFWSSSSFKFLNKSFNDFSSSFPFLFWMIHSSWQIVLHVFLSATYCTNFVKKNYPVLYISLAFFHFFFFFFNTSLRFTLAFFYFWLSRSPFHSTLPLWLCSSLLPLSFRY